MSTDSLEISYDDFLRRVTTRKSGLMWFLGAGASVPGGLPSGGSLIWEFKQKLYASQRKVPWSSVCDLSIPGVTEKIQEHINSLPDMPEPGAPEEYSILFEAAFPSQIDRQKLIEEKMKNAKPSYGHLIFANMLRKGIIHVTWTTNFDPLIEDSFARIAGQVSPLSTFTTENASGADSRIKNGKYPILVKIHGDFKSVNSKNIDSELRKQEYSLQTTLKSSCQQKGLVLAGYSGRDESVISVLESALEENNPYPNGLFWLERSSSKLLPRVQKFLSEARSNGVEAHLVKIEGFEELMQDVARMLPDAEEGLDQHSPLEKHVWSPPPKPAGKQGWPVIRLNALPIQSFPRTCRLVECEIGNHKEVQQALSRTSEWLIGTRTRKGVVVFGEDRLIDDALAPYNITRKDIWHIFPKNLRRDSAEKRLLKDALSYVLWRELGLNRVRTGVSDCFVPIDPNAEQWRGVAGSDGLVTGTIEAGEATETWYEGVEITIAWVNETPWMVFEPNVIFGPRGNVSGISESEIRRRNASRSDFKRERTVKRYNQNLNLLLEEWSRLLSLNNRVVRALEVREGFDASFQIGTTNAYTRRLSA